MDANKRKFHKLTPTPDTKLGIYEEALAYVFSDNDLKNIAITGSYSSGKSSMLEAYKNKWKEKKFIHISLTHFETATNLSTGTDGDEETPNADTRSKTVDESELEGKIINQLIHQIDPKNIPQTKFKVKRPFKIMPSIATIAIAIIFLLSLIFLLNRNAWRTFVNGITVEWINGILRPTTTDGFAIGAIGIFILILSRGLFCFLKLQHNKNILRKFSVQGNEIEVFDDKEDMLFDKHLNEVLYLFEKTKADAIVFEDMDRYNSNQIFKKLKEINYLLNNSPKREKGRIFRFFYLLRDDIFTSKDRTKFFDFIIPIVPIIDGANSFEKFMKYFDDGNILKDLDSSFLQNISLYVDDMRLLKNIYNEYIIYSDRIGATELNRNKLLAMIAYKNLFPKDFSELQLGKGYVSCLFNNKPQFIKDEIDRIEKSISEKKALLDRAEQEQVRDIDELDLIFFTGNKDYINFLQNLDHLDINGKGLHAFNSMTDLINEIKSNLDNLINRRSNHYHATNVATQIVYNFINDPKYLNRKESIKTKTARISKELQQLDIQKKGLESATLREIVHISKEIDSLVFSVNHTIKDSLYYPLIKFLIRNGYIDEGYSDYMSYFYGHSISAKDKNFLLSITDEKAKHFTYPLDDAQMIASKISPRYYSQTEVLNFDLFAFLLQSQNDNLNAILNQIRTNKRIDFVLEFWQTDKEKEQLIQHINKTWPSVWQELSKTATEEIKKQYLVDTFYYSPHDDITKMNIDNAMTNYISSCADFLAIPEPGVSSIVEALQFLTVRFSSINYDVSNKELFQEVYAKDLYEINEPLISLFLQEIYRIPKSEDYHHKNYSLIRTKPEEPLAVYIGKNMNAYVSIVLDICNGSIVDDEADAISILNEFPVDQNLKEDYIRALETEIKQLDGITENALWPTLLSQHKVPCSKANILACYYNSGNAFDTILTDFINTSESETGLSYDEIMDQYGEEQTIAFYKDLMTNNDLDNEKYIILLSAFGESDPIFSFRGIGADKVKILISLKIIQMNETNLSFMRDNYPACTMSFIIKNMKAYAQDVISEGNFDLSELQSLLSKEIDDPNLLKLLSFTAEPISIENKEVSDAVKKHILENNYCEDDLAYLVSLYESENTDIRKILSKMCEERVDRIIAGGISLPYDLLITLLREENTPMKKELLASQLESITREQAVECFTKLNMKELLTVFEGNERRPVIEKNDANTRILTIMKDKGWISSFASDRNKPESYRVWGKRNITNKDSLSDELL